ncbi:DNA glycosylase, partial [Dissophora ornata]
VDAARVRTFGRHSQSYHRFTTQETRKRVHDNLLAWYDVHHRKLPWRRDFHNPSPTKDENPGQRAYEVWVSEIMCQQTQVGTVIPYYNTWMTKWPTIADLAAADLEDVNKVWTGLGYYSRASRLHSGAQKVAKDFDGVLPSDPVVLEKEVPGIGRYTAGAIVSHAYNIPAELVDGNVIRVLSRLRAIGGDVKGPKVIDLHWQIAKELVHQERPGCFNQALMELGAVVCTPQNPRCGECPVQTSCRAYAEEAIGASQKRSTKGEEDEDHNDDCTLCLPETEVEGKDQGLVTQYPRKAAKKAPRDEECAVAILERVRSDPEGGESISEFLLVKRPGKGLLAGMWEFPTVEQDRLRSDHKDMTTPSTYHQRSESSRKYLVETLKLGWIKGCNDIQRRDLGSAQHLFSHIRKIYHAEWVLVKDPKEGNNEGERKKNSSANGPEIEWLTADALATAAIPTGINKTFQLLQKYKSEENSGGAKRKKTAESGGASGKDKKKARKADWAADISAFFKAPSK